MDPEAALTLLKQEFLVSNEHVRRALDALHGIEVGSSFLSPEKSLKARLGVTVGTPQPGAWEAYDPLYFQTAAAGLIRLRQQPADFQERCQRHLETLGPYIPLLEAIATGSLPELSK